MKKIVLAMAAIVMVVNVSVAQKYKTRTGKVTFFSSTPLENIEAFNNEAASVLDAGNGDFIFQVPIQSFKFDKALMQTHFNENYMESDKYPKAEYSGTVKDISSVNFSKDGNYKVTSAGRLTIHGVTKEVTIPGTITVKGNEITIKSEFKVKPKDYNIEIPSLVEEKIAKEIEVTVNSIMKRN